MKTKGIIFLAGIIFIFGILFVSAIETSYCCEKLKDNGPFCQNAPLSQCDSKYKAVPTACEATSYCKLGCCNIIDKGECMQNTPLATCGNSTDTGINFIDSNPSCDVDQCKLGCCLMGDQAAFVTQTKCNKLSAVYGLEINYRPDITNELDCLETGTALVDGACVFEKEFTRTCKMMNQQECKEMSANEENQNVRFYKEHLCSDPELGTECAPSEDTMLVEGKDGVYWKDTCGNPANIYDSSKSKDMSYWKEIVKKEDSCGAEESNAESPDCGNCNYILGSIGKEYTRKDFRVGVDSPTYGDYMCKDLSCEYDNDGDGEMENYLHGESWCAHNIYLQTPEQTKKQTKGIGTLPILIKDGFIVGMDIDYEDQKWTRDQELVEPDLWTANLPGSRYFRLVCFNGEVSVEPCADFRQEVCIESTTDNARTETEMSNLIREPAYKGFSFDGYRSAQCRTNRWQDCTLQTTKTDCWDIEKRDCRLVYVGGEDGKIEKDDNEERKNYVCAPLYPPGLQFWGEDTSTEGVQTSGNTGMAADTSGDIAGDASTVCSLASGECEITYEMGTRGKNPFDSDNWKYETDKEHVKEGMYCYKDEWQINKEKYAWSLGDCAKKSNYLGYLGSSDVDVDKEKLSKWN